MDLELQTYILNTHEIETEISQMVVLETYILKDSDLETILA